MKIIEGVNYVGQRIVVNAGHTGDPTFIGMTGIITEAEKTYVWWKADGPVAGRISGGKGWYTPACLVDLIITPNKNKLGNFSKRRV